MTTLRVWAPKAGAVAVALGAERVPMARGAGGWWHADLPHARPGDDYVFILDGGEPLPDPRSRWQPEGGHGPSRLVDLAAFEWHDAGWQAPPLASAVFYELHVGTFTPGGTFESAIERLDHLVDLGVTHVELLPVAEFPGARGWGYDGVDLYAPHHAYGGPQGLLRLVDACHTRGLAVVLDVVYNHLGPDGNYLARFGPYFTERYTTPWGEAVNFDGPSSDAVRRFFVDNARAWLRDYHVDGLRLDAVHAIVDRSAVHILEELAREVRALEIELGRRLVLVAESDLNDPRVVQAHEVGGYAMDAQWSDNFHHALHALLTGEREGYYADFGAWSHLAKALERVFVYDGNYAPTRERHYGRPVGDLPGYRFLGYMQNHDQVGNRAQGDRSSHLLSTGQLKIAAALVLTAPFVPLLFQGEEWGATTPFLYFTDHQDPKLAEAVKKGRREEFTAFGWDPAEIPDPQARETFARSRLNWEERERRSHAELLEWHRQLIRLRRTTPALLDGRLDRVAVRYAEDAGWLVVERGPVVVAVNLTGAARPVALNRPGRLMLASDPQIALSGERVHLPPHSVAIVG